MPYYILSLSKGETNNGFREETLVMLKADLVSFKSLNSGSGYEIVINTVH